MYDKVILWMNKFPSGRPYTGHRAVGAFADPEMMATTKDTRRNEGAIERKGFCGPKVSSDCCGLLPG